MDIFLNKIKKYIPKKLFKALQPIYHFILAWLAAFWYRWPSNKLIVIGVTGTTGKTTSIYLMAKVLESAGYKVGYTSTAMFNDGKNEWLNDKKMTMAGRFFTQKILREMVSNGCQYAIIETTSEGIIQFRHRFINYDLLIFTGIYPEHIEAHGSFLNYRNAKGKLFAHLKNCQTKYINNKKIVVNADSGIKKIDLTRVKKATIINADDKEVIYFSDFWAEEKWNYKILDRSKSDLANSNTKVIYYGNIESNEIGVNFIVEGNKIHLKLLGEYNVANAMTAVCLCLSQGLSLQQIKTGLENINGLPGRLEKIDQGQPYKVIVDYAFEPRAMEKLYKVISQLPHKRVIHVLGSTGGGRDTSRRSKLGELAGEKADIVIVTNEDPYDDDPIIIINEVVHGAISSGKTYGKNLLKIINRRQAINKALSLAKKDDIVLITGKGCEQAICLAGGKKIPWDDRRVVREELEKLEVKNGK